MDEPRILVIESDPACVGFLEQCLRRAGFEGVMNRDPSDGDTAVGAEDGSETWGGAR